MTKGTPSRGKHSKKKSHIHCRRCGSCSYHVRRKICSKCGYGRSKRLRSYAWQKK